MQHLEHPSRELWEERRQWFESVDEQCQGQGCYMLSEQACALTADVQSAFCAGAWGSSAPVLPGGRIRHPRKQARPRPAPLPAVLRPLSAVVFRLRQSCAGRPPW